MPDPTLEYPFSPQNKEAWQNAAVASLKGKPFDRLIKPKYEGFDQHPLLQAADIAELAYLQANPGHPPYVRGTVAAPAPWLIAQEIPLGDPAAYNSALRDALERGQTAVHLTVDPPTRAGTDPDQADPAQIGRGGLSITTAADFQTALAGVDLTAQPLLLTPGAAARPLLALLLASQPPETAANLTGLLLADPVAALLRDGRLPTPLPAARAAQADLLRWTAQHAPGMRTLAAIGDVYHDAGAHAAQELAFTLASGVAAVRGILDWGLGIAEVAPRFTAVFAVGGDFFMEVAKLRAARLLWAQMIAAFSGDAAAQKLFIHARTARRNKSAVDPHVNMLRVTTEAFAAVVGGADSLHVDPYDAVSGASTPFAMRIARNVQLILREEANLTRLVDPAGGAYLVEALTDRLARDAWTLFQEIESRGGMDAVAQTDFVHKTIAATAAARWSDFQRRKAVLVGANRYPPPQKLPLPNPDWAALTAARKAAAQAARKQPPPALSNPPTFTELLNAAKNGATLAQLTPTNQLSNQPLTPYRPAAEIAALQGWSAAYASENGAPPRIFLANIGPLARHKPRADFTREFFAVGGFEFVENGGVTAVADAVAAAKAAGTPLIAICGHNDDYPAFVPAFVHAMKMEAPGVTLILAGKPPNLPDYEAAGIDAAIAIGSNVIELNQFAQQKLTEAADDAA